MFHRIQQWFSRPAPTPESPKPSPDASERAKALRTQGNRFLDQGDLARAKTCYQEALALVDDDTANLVNLGFVLTELGQLVEARDCLARAIALDRNSCDSLYLMGTVCEKMGALDQAASHYQDALLLKPEFDYACRDLVRVLFHLGRWDEAQQRLLQGLTVHPRMADLHLYQGHLDMSSGHSGRALQSYQQAVDLARQGPHLHAALGHAQEKLNHLEAAARSFQAAHALEPGNPDYLKSLADIHQKQGLHESALALYRQGLAIAPEHPNLLANMSLPLCALGQLEAAKAACKQAIRLAPELMAARNNLSIALTQMGDLSGAIECLQEATERQPDFAQAHCNLGAAHQKQGNLSQAIFHYRKALSLDPAYLEAHSNLLFVLSFDTETSPTDFLAEARAFGVQAKKLVADATPGETLKPGALKLRVGLLSGDFHEHPVGFFLENILGHLDPERIELVAYATQNKEDALTDRIRPAFKAWRTIAGLSDQLAAEVIRQDGIDILIDLAGHTAHNRLSLFAWRPAPVAVSWLGWFATTGMEDMDYFIADSVSVPPAHRAHFSETVWDLPDTRFCFTPPTSHLALEVTALPALRTGYPTFGCFQQMGKINDRVLLTWSQIANSLPLARFHVQNEAFNAEDERERFRARLHRAGLAPERFNLCGATSREAYLRTYQTVDMVLDTFPFNGATTTCEALWMGVPTLTLAGDRLVSRQGASLMSCAGLADWVAEDESSYVALAVHKASDLNALDHLRQVLRATVLASPLFDAPTFAGHLQQALEAMWARHWQASISAPAGK